MDLQAIKPKSLRSLREKIEKRKKERLLGSCSPKKSKLKQDVSEENEGLLNLFTFFKIFLYCNFNQNAMQKLKGRFFNIYLENL